MDPLALGGLPWLRLAAAFFSSRPNNKDDPDCFFTSIAYQLAMKYPLYHDKLERKIHRDPTLVKKSLPVQFRELILSPFQELQRRGAEEGVIFVDGLDECHGEDAQCTIIDLITASVRDQSMPFIWAFFSRPEPRIVAQFSSPSASELCWRLTLPVSRDADGEIELYLRDGFKRIRTQYDIPSSVSRPSEDDIQQLVDRAAGLFIYIATAVRFISEGGPLGPEEQLRLILSLSSEASKNPWTHLDAFHTLIMEQVPKEILPDTLKLLLANKLLGYGDAVVTAAGINFSLLTFSAALSKLHSVVELTRSKEGLPLRMFPYHASFDDFLQDPGLSGRFCIKTNSHRTGLLEDLIGLFNKGFGNIVSPWNDSRFFERGDVGYELRCNGLYAFWEE